MIRCKIKCHLYNKTTVLNSVCFKTSVFVCQIFPPEAKVYLTLGSIVILGPKVYFILCLTHCTTDCFDDRLLLRRQIRVNFAGKG